MATVSAIMKVGIIGSGIVAETLGGGFIKHGHDVALGTRDPSKLAKWLKENPTGRVGSFADAAGHGDVVVLAVKGSAASDALRAAGVANLDGKVVIDATNPIADVPPQKGVLTFFTDLNESLMERLQREFSGAHFVKAFNSVGAPCMVNPQFAGGKPTMFIAGDNGDAKKTVTMLIHQLGWETEDMGPAEAARDRAVVHSVVHPGLRGARLDARVQDAAVIAGCGGRASHLARVE